MIGELATGGSEMKKVNAFMDQLMFYPINGRQCKSTGREIQKSRVMPW
jgi:hypothetical protein